MNIYTVPAGLGGECTVVVDLAHNEAGLEALMDVSDGLRQPGSRVHLGLGAAGDRTDEILENLGEIAGHRADHVVAAHKAHYLRGRTMEELEGHLRTGLQRAGVADIASLTTELAGLQALVEAAHEGDVVAIMCHAERQEIYDWLDEVGGVADGPRAIRRKVVGARGEHEAEEAIAELWAQDDADRRIEIGAALHEAYPQDARITYEYGGTFDSAGQEERALELYRTALDGGLREPYRHRAVIQLASSLRNVGAARRGGPPARRARRRAPRVGRDRRLPGARPALRRSLRGSPRQPVGGRVAVEHGRGRAALPTLAHGIRAGARARRTVRPEPSPVDARATARRRQDRSAPAGSESWSARSWSVASSPLTWASACRVLGSRSGSAIESAVCVPG